MPLAIGPKTVFSPAIFNMKQKGTDLSFAVRRPAGDADIRVTTSKVKVTIVSASGLKDADFGILDTGTSDPYVEARWDGKRVHKTKVVNNKLDPTWGSSESFELEIDDETEKSLTLTVYDKDISLGKGGTCSLW